MSRIVKSIGVVDERERSQQVTATQREAKLFEGAVIKKWEVSGVHTSITATAFPTVAQGIEELNRITLEIAQAKIALRSVKTSLYNAKENRGQDRQTDDDDDEDQQQNDSESTTQQEIEQLLADAKDQAGTILGQAKNSAIQLQEQYKNEGYLEGFTQGTADAAQEFDKQAQPKLAELQHILDTLSSYEEQMLNRHETQIIELVSGIASKVIGREIKADSKAIVSMLHETLHENRKEEFIKITLSPDMLPVKAKANAEVRELITKETEHITIIIDKDAAPATILVETPKGFTDISVDTQLENLSQAMSEQ